MSSIGDSMLAANYADAYDSSSQFEFDLFSGYDGFMDDLHAEGVFNEIFLLAADDKTQCNDLAIETSEESNVFNGDEDSGDDTLSMIRPCDSNDGKAPTLAHFDEMANDIGTFFDGTEAAAGGSNFESNEYISDANIKSMGYSNETPYDNQIPPHFSHQQRCEVAATNDSFVARTKVVTTTDGHAGSVDHSGTSYDIGQLPPEKQHQQKKTRTKRTSAAPAREKVKSSSSVSVPLLKQQRKRKGEERGFKTDAEVVNFPHAYHSAFNAQDFETMERLLNEFFGDGFEGRAPFMQHNIVGRTGFLETFKSMIPNRPDLVHRVISSKICIDRQNHAARFLAVKISSSYTRIETEADRLDEGMYTDRETEDFFDAKEMSPEDIEKALQVLVRVRRTKEAHRVEGLVWFRYNLDDNNVITDFAFTNKFTSVTPVDLEG